MIKYSSFRYIYPPRPEVNLPSYELSKYDNGLWLGQPKLNGSNLVIFTNGTELCLYNRHNDIMSGIKMKEHEFLSLHRGNGWIVLNGEYMNKSKNDANGQIFNHKLVIFDILVYNGVQTIGMDFVSRVELLNKLYPSVNHDGYINKVDNNIFKVKSFDKGFNEVYQKITQIDMYEGWVLKKKSAKLKNGLSEKNNTDSQIKFRKPTKNYNY